MRSWIARWKAARTFRIPAGDPADEEDCDCGYYLLTESGIPIGTEGTDILRPET